MPAIDPKAFKYAQHIFITKLKYNILANSI